MNVSTPLSPWAAGQATIAWPASMVSATAATVQSVAIVALVCFLAGLIARSMTAQQFVRGLENTVLSKAPAYEYLNRRAPARLASQR